MKNEKNLTSIKAVMDAAKEIEAGGEAHHKIFGEISISLERLLKVNVLKQKSKDRNGNETEVELPNNSSDKWSKEEIQNFIDSLFEGVKKYLEIIYGDQKEKRDFFKKIFYWGYVAMFITAVGTALVISWPF